MAPLRKHFTRDLDSLGAVFDLLDLFATQEELDTSSQHDLALALDELFTNMVKYQPANRNDIEIELRAEQETVTVKLVDRDVDKFDLTAKQDPYLGRSVKKRAPGGLGIYLTKRVVDDVQYHYGDRTSTITLIKKFRRRHV